jgi:hypothetical protein
MNEFLENLRFTVENGMFDALEADRYVSPAQSLKMIEGLLKLLREENA